LLGDAPCKQQPCTSLVRTTDGGRSFVGVPAPKAAVSVNEASRESVREVRFADGTNGWTFGAGLWATHDGSRTWNRVGLDGDVSDLAAASGRAWLILGHCTPSQGCSSYDLLTSPVDADHWTRVTTPKPLGGDAAPPALAVQDGAVYLHTFTPDHSIYASHDGGRTFNSHPGPCSPGLGGSLTGTPTALWAVCGTGMQADLLRSTDGGAHFAEVPHPTVSNGVKLAAANTLTAVIGDSADLLRTTDGAHWASVHDAGEGTWLFIGFTTPTVADAIFQSPTGPAQLLRTTDSGRTWQPVDIH
jgi:photosystem II stability/assembly factor-like uncharacterized protein